MGLWVEAPPHPAPVANSSPEPVEAPPDPAPVADSSREQVEAPPHPTPVADSSPAKLSVTSSQSGGSVDLLADGRSESSESVWDYDERPLTQVSLKRSLEDSRQEYRDAAWAAPPTAANAPISQDLSDMPMPCGDQNVRLRLDKWQPSSLVISAPERSMCGALCDGSIVSFV